MIDYVSKIQILLMVYILISGVIAWSCLRQKSIMSGIVLAYLMDFTIMQFPGAWVYSNRWYSPESRSILDSQYGIEHIYNGFFIVCCGLLAFCLGVIAYLRFRRKPVKAPEDFDGNTSLNVRKLARKFFIYGFIINIGLEAVTRNIPSLNMIVAVSFKFFVIGLVLYLWDSMKSEKTKRFYLVLGAALICLPIYTMVSDGFMSFAINALIPLFALTILYFKPRKQLVLLLACLFWVGASFFVNYMQIRDDLREAVWHESSSEKAFSILEGSMRNFEGFNPKKISHLEALDLRLNQNSFIGLAKEYIEQGNIDFAKGRTLNYALIAMVPRSIWPDKPVYGGSMGIVADYSGLRLDESTSFGVGQVMEFYINFGMIGVFSGFFILGIVIAYFDINAGACLAANNYHKFVYWFLPGLGFINSLGLFAETVGTVWISFVTYWIVSKLMKFG